MPVTWTIEKIEQEIKKAKNIADIANIFSLVFGLSRIEKEIADYQQKGIIKGYKALINCDG